MAAVGAASVAQGVAATGTGTAAAAAAAITGGGGGGVGGGSGVKVDPIQRYKLIAQIGHGGYGAVYKALDIATQSIVAIKVINLEESGEGLEDVGSEISVMCDVSCPQLIKYHCSYVVKDVLWIVMEFLEAGSLSDILKEFGPLDEECIAFVLRELLCALDYLHSQRKIHRDVKAGNVLVGRDGHIKLSDFGVTGQLTDRYSNNKQQQVGKIEKRLHASCLLLYPF